MILAGDIGGTNSRLAIFDADLNKVHEGKFQNKNRSGLGEIVQEFLHSTGAKPQRAAMGIAGPIKGGRVRMTNLPWDEFSESGLSQQLGIPAVALINDLRAHAEGIEVLPADRFETLIAGAPQAGGNRAVIAAGTGLGEAGLLFDVATKRYQSFASEGGHCDFSPREEREDRLLAFLRKSGKPPTWESVLSGPGLRNCYDFVTDPSEPKVHGHLPPDPAPADITQAAMNDTSAAAALAMDLFISLYASEAGNLALKMLATAGVYLGGGIAPRIIEKLKTPAFVESFRRKGPPKMRAMIDAIPVYVITFDNCGLYGAANYARRM